MTDAATTGFEAEPSDVQAMRDNLLAELADDTDPLSRYTTLTAEQARTEALVSEIKKLRGVELRRMADGDPDAGQPGLTEQRIAEITGLGSKQRVNQLIAPSSRPRNKCRPGCTCLKHTPRRPQ